MLRALGQNGADADTPFLQPTDQFQAFVCRDAAGNHQQQALALKDSVIRRHGQRSPMEAAPPRDIGETKPRAGQS
ncbi:hypothetical protein AZA_22284 [Nitrospirillum viridazoti Y2]|nr:hypothetical protein AZA_22284 [Nitrospirillum amazonense Y2]